MKNFKHELWQSAKVLAIALVLSVGVQYAFAWTGPTQAPPSGNTSAPINVSATSQVKSGGLGVTNFLADSVTVGASVNSAAITSPKFCIGSSCITAWPSAGSGANSGGGNLLGAWENKSDNTVYQATTDGFVLAHRYNLQYGSVGGYTDSSNPPGTRVSYESGYNGEDTGAITFPVRKGDYWKTTGASEVRWIGFTN